MLHFIGQSLFWLVFCVILMSFAEHQIHRTLMHRRNFLSDRFAAFKKTFEHHAIIHHGHYSAEFCDEPVAPGKDRHIRLSMEEGFIESLPFAALIALVSIQGAITMVAVVQLHHFLWNIFHLEMHKPEKRFFSEWPIYKFLCRHHYLHHKYPNKNFNVVFPFADYVLGTNAGASESELKEMSGMGII